MTREQWIYVFTLLIWPALVINTVGAVTSLLAFVLDKHSFYW